MMSEKTAKRNNKIRTKYLKNQQQQKKKKKKKKKKNARQRAATWPHKERKIPSPQLS